jgi:hypothetical protein
MYLSLKVKWKYLWVINLYALWKFRSKDTKYINKKCVIPWILYYHWFLRVAQFPVGKYQTLCPYILACRITQLWLNMSQCLACIYNINKFENAFILAYGHSCKEFSIYWHLINFKWVTLILQMSPFVCELITHTVKQYVLIRYGKKVKWRNKYHTVNRKIFFKYIVFWWFCKFGFLCYIRAERILEERWNEVVPFTHVQ